MCQRCRTTPHACTLCSPLYRHLQMKLITVSTVSERLKINGSLTRIALKDLCNRGLIKNVAFHGAQLIYTKA